MTMDFPDTASSGRLAQDGVRPWPVGLFVFRGDTPTEAKALMGEARGLCDAAVGGTAAAGADAAAVEAADNALDPALWDLARRLARHGEGGPVQYAIVAGGPDELSAALDAVRHDRKDKGVYPLMPVEGQVAFLFPGQGSQRVNMAAGLFAAFPRMRRLLDAFPEYGPVLFPPAAQTPAEERAQRAAITDTRNAQPLLGLVDLAIAELLRDLGLAADMVAGHSYGELPALCFAGVLAPEDLLPTSRLRAQSVLAALGPDPGRMAAVRADGAAVAALLAGVGDVWAVNLNAPQQTVVAGTSAGIEAFLGRLEAAGVSASGLDVACAFHSPLLREAEGLFAEVLKDVAFSKAGLPVWSNTTAERYPEDPEAIKRRLAEHLVGPVRFVEETERMYDEGARVFVEAGPGTVLTGLAKRILGRREAVLIQTEREGTEAVAFLLHALARYLSTGRDLHLDRLFESHGTAFSPDDTEVR
ncbi:MAG: ACP S-malonyltransferase [Coriobacteriales bacterium]|jgi:acyl transferase domain-containing protein|nr:ACP S-malonyltransferase [Coriobacteriales bacterium]